MRIALLPSNYAPAVGGVEVLTARLARQLILRGHAVEVWAPRSNGDALPQMEILDGITVRRFVFTMPRADLRTLTTLPLGAWRTIVELRAAAAAFEPTHLHVQCFSANGLYATVLTRLTRTPLIVTLQGETVMDDHDIYERSTTLRAALRWGLHSATAVTGCSQFTLDDAQRRFRLDPAKASVIFNGVDLDETAPQAVPLPFDRYVLALGRAVGKKGFDLLLAAFAKIAADKPGVGLVIGGDGAQLEPLKSFAEELGIRDRVHFPGRLNRAEVSAVMEGAAVFVMPSRVEPFGIVALEGWRAGKPVVVTSLGGPPEFVRHGINGMVANPFDEVELAGCIIQLLDNEILAATIARTGRTDLDHFQWSELIHQYEHVYEHALAMPGFAPDDHA